MKSLKPGLVAAAALSLLAGGGGGFFAYHKIVQALEAEARQDMEAVIAERSRTETDLFTDVIAAQTAVLDIYRRTHESLTPAQVDAVFEQTFIEFGDGTRRTPPELFDGTSTPEVDVIYGMGGFMGMANGLDAATRRAMAAGYLTIARSGPALVERFDNVYFNDGANNMVMFGPRREDRLSYYRETAPADFDVRGLPMVQMMLPANNPMGRTACTHLTNPLYRRANAPTLTIGCHTPVRIAGRHLGAIGMTLDVRNYLTNAVSGHLPGSEDMVITREGALVAHSELIEGNTIAAERIEALTERLQPAQLARAILGYGRTSGVLAAPDGNSVIGFARIEAAGWIVVSQRPYGPIRLQAFFLALVLGSIIAAAILSQAHMIAGSPVLRWTARPTRPDSQPASR